MSSETENDSYYSDSQNSSDSDYFIYLTYRACREMIDAFDADSYSGVSLTEEGFYTFSTASKVVQSYLCTLDGEATADSTLLIYSGNVSFMYGGFASCYVSFKVLEEEDKSFEYCYVDETACSGFTSYYDLLDKYGE